MINYIICWLKNCLFYSYISFIHSAQFTKKSIKLKSFPIDLSDPDFSVVVVAVGCLVVVGIDSPSVVYFQKSHLNVENPVLVLMAEFSISKYRPTLSFSWAVKISRFIELSANGCQYSLSIDGFKLLGSSYLAKFVQYSITFSVNLFDSREWLEVNSIPNVTVGRSGESF